MTFTSMALDRKQVVLIILDHVIYSDYNIYADVFCVTRSPSTTYWSALSILRYLGFGAMFAIKKQSLNRTRSL